jgi:galactonate dehydratase
MKITALKTYIVAPRWLFLKVETDEGISGWGEPVLEGHAETLATKIAELSDFVIGLDPRRIEDIWQMLYRNGCYRGGPVLMSAISGLDTALWDIKGRALGVPIYELLGGPVRDTVRSYCWIGGDRPSGLIEGATALRDKGFDAVKFNICEELQIVDTYAKVDGIIQRLSELRDVIGATMDLAFDFHGRVHLPMARVLLKELEPLRPIFVEDAVVSAMVESMADLARSTSIPLCIGERLHSRYDFKKVFELRLAPHCPLGPIALASCLQVNAVCHNAFIQEQSLGIHYNQGGDLLDYTVPGQGFTLTNGRLTIPTGPGLGIEVNEDKVIEASKIGHKWRAPIWRHQDGSIAEW